MKLLATFALLITLPLLAAAQSNETLTSTSVNVLPAGEQAQVFAADAAVLAAQKALAVAEQTLHDAQKQQGDVYEAVKKAHGESYEDWLPTGLTDGVSGTRVFTRVTIHSGALIVSSGIEHCLGSLYTIKETNGPVTRCMQSRGR